MKVRELRIPRFTVQVMSVVPQTEKIWKHIWPGQISTINMDDMHLMMLDELLQEKEKLNEDTTIYNRLGRISVRFNRFRRQYAKFSEGKKGRAQ